MVTPESAVSFSLSPVLTGTLFRAEWKRQIGQMEHELEFDKAILEAMKPEILDRKARMTKSGAEGQPDMAYEVTPRLAFAKFMAIRSRKEDLKNYGK